MRILRRIVVLSLWVLPLISACRAPIVDVRSPDSSAAVLIDVSTLDTMPVLSSVEHRLSEIEFGSIRAMALTPSALFVVDVLNDEVLSFDLDGRLNRRFGSTGEGPGELTAPRGVAVVQDTVFVLDRHGLSVFSLNGEFRRRSTLRGIPDVTAGFVPHPQDLLRSCDGLLVTYRWSLSDHSSPFADTVHVYRLNGEGEVGELSHHIITDYIYRSGPNVRGPPLFVPRRHVIPDSDCTLVALLQDGRTIERISRDGSLHARLQLDGPRRPVSAADVDTLLSEPVRAPEGTPKNVLQRAKADRRRHPQARVRGFINEILLDAEGNMVIRRADQSPISSMARDPATWEILSPDGSPRGRLRVPAAFRPRQALPGVLVGVLTNPDESESLVIYKYGELPSR